MRTSRVSEESLCEGQTDRQTDADRRRLADADTDTHKHSLSVSVNVFKVLIETLKTKKQKKDRGSRLGVSDRVPDNVSAANAFSGLCQFGQRSGAGPLTRR